MSMPATAAQNYAARAAEPSMEEILASIRKIIADDQKALERKLEAQAPAAPQEALQATVAPEALLVPDMPDNDIAAEEEVLDLAEVTAEPIAPAAPYVPPPPVRPEFAAAPAAPTPAPASVAHAAPHGLLSDGSAEAATASFQTLAHAVLSQNARTLDDLVKDMLKPMLASWLNENLPSLVERLVRAEIERVARGGR